jgi:glycosyltransferase involved in cell wall biosynthesis
MYVKEFGGKAKSYFPVPDKKFKSRKSISSKRIRRVFFYLRPYDSRNGFTLGMAGLKEIKKRHPKIEIIAAGADVKFNDHGLKIKQLGKVPFDQLPELYASCDVGIYLLFSKHTGVIPFELMASGCAVLTNRRYYKSCLKDMKNCIMFDPTPSSMADAFDILCNEKIRRKIIIEGLKFINKMSTLEEEMNKIYRFMTS